MFYAIYIAYELRLCDKPKYRPDLDFPALNQNKALASYNASTLVFIEKKNWK